MDEQNLQERFFNNQCTKEEAERFIKWYLSGKGEKEIEEQIENYWQSNTNSEWDSEKLLARVNAIKNESDLFVSHNADSYNQVKSVRRNYFFPKNWRIAASVTLIIGLSYLAMNLFTNNPEESDYFVEYIEKSNPSGQKSTVHLKDGSRIILNSNSKVRYPIEFANNERVIELVGEAYFEVARDVSRPFRVKTANTMTTALGTTFNIDAFEDEDDVKISLTSGRIEVKKLESEGDEKPFELVPGQGVIYSRLDKSMVQTDIDVDKVTAWTSKELIFHNEDINEVIRRLERWYGVEITVEDKIDGVFSASFKNESLKAVLEGISYSFSLDYLVSDKKVILKSKDIFTN
ncbi:FecR domain-containing protein [Reichenbachiella sp. MALMAid0571]|uniref:FecR family protein n=1 Tax=Reichenbachiella sp. MALMAid0571 TaxID=3143939 RepID=UPI0032DE304F